MSRAIITTSKDDPLVQEMKSPATDGKVLFVSYRENDCALLYRDNRILAVQIYSNQMSRLIDSVYIAKIRDVVKNMDAYFVEIQKELVCFLPGKTCKNPILINRVYDGRLLQGDHILVRVTKDAQKTKPPMVSADLSGEKYHPYLTASAHKSCYTCLKPPLKPWQTALKDVAYPDEYTEIITDNTALYNDLVTTFQEKESALSIRLYDNTSISLFGLYGLNKKLENAFNKRVWLKSGAYLIIEPTEALTVIDVNSGKFEARKAMSEYAFDVNLEAAAEIALQLRLRNLSGIILIDFINMHNKELEEDLLEAMKNFVRTDRIPTRVVDLTPLGLMELTRQKSSRPLHEQICKKT